MERDRLIVVGGGAAGMMAAVTAARAGARVLLLERNPKVGRKLYITGKGRCNLTNRCTPEEALKNTPRNGKFLWSAMSAFPPSETERFFEALGVPLKAERGNRVFPASDRSADIIDALFFALKRAGVSIVQARAEEILTENGQVSGVLAGELYPCKAALLATGGLSYPATGSTGDGYAMAGRLGHSIVPTGPSLVPLESPDGCCAQMQGLALKHVALAVKTRKDKVVYREQGELLFTHFGLSGPLVLSASAHMRDFGREQYVCSIDLKPALDEAALDARLLRELGARPNVNLSTLLGALLPRGMIGPFLEKCALSGEEKAHDLTKGERRRLLERFKGFPVAVSGPRPVAEAIITSGGVKVSEADPKTMMSKKVPGLFFAGELLDVDAYTGGFNLQIAWATGRAAGAGAAEFLSSPDGRSFS